MQYPFDPKTMLIPKTPLRFCMTKPFKKHPNIFKLSTHYPFITPFNVKLEKKYYNLAKDFYNISKRVFTKDNRKELVILCPGVFDMLHPNHLASLNTATLIAGDRGQIIIPLDSDQKCFNRKNKYPIIHEDLRKKNPRKAWS